MIKEEYKLQVGDIVTYRSRMFGNKILTGEVVKTDNYPHIVVKFTQDNMVNCLMFLDAKDCVVH